MKQSEFEIDNIVLICVTVDYYMDSPALSMEDMFLDPQWMPEAVDSTKH